MARYLWYTYSRRAAEKMTKKSAGVEVVEHGPLRDFLWVGRYSPSWLSFDSAFSVGCFPYPSQVMNTGRVAGDTDGKG